MTRSRNVPAWLAVPICIGVLACSAPAPAGEAAVTLESLLDEMIDFGAVASWPQPQYTCRQASSYDRRSKTPKDPDGWFANTDNMDGSGDSLRWETISGRRECVLLDVDGPGCIVRFWSGGQRPKGNLRFYLDGAAEPAIEAPMHDLMSGKLMAPRPLAIQNAGDAINLYLPVPYAKHCKITYDESRPGKPDAPPPGRWYNIEYRTYSPPAAVKTFTMADFKALAAAGKIESICKAFSSKGLEPPAFANGKAASLEKTIEPGMEASVELPAGPAAVRTLELRIEGVAKEHPAGTFGLQQALRSTVLCATFDGDQTIWCPVGDFFGTGVGLNALSSWYRTVSKDGVMSCRWVMPYEKSASLTVLNLGKEKLGAKLRAAVGGWDWGPRSMHFHANWRQEYPIRTRPFKDWNYIEIAGRGVYLGDTLSLLNPVKDWWGEGDEKIWVDLGAPGFPSHFGTGSEDYYCYAWGNPTLFQGPFANQVRCDGPGNLGQTVVTRTRSLDAIPFTKSLKMDMEVWHWRDCEVAYAVATYWYARPGAKCNRGPARDEAARPVPQPPPPPKPLVIPGAVECETMRIVTRSDDVQAGPQPLDAFGGHLWSKANHLFVRGTKVGAFVELRFAVQGAGPRKLTLYATKSHDYGILRFSVNGKPACNGKDVDTYSPQPCPSGPIELGTFEPVDGAMTLRVEVVGRNPKSKLHGAYFGLDCVAVTEPVASSQ